MTDILTRFVTAVESIAASLADAKASKVAVPLSAPTKTETKTETKTKPTENKAPAADKNAAAATSGGKADANKGAPAGTTKAPGGKRSLDDVRNMIRKVATTEGLGKQTAIDILDEDGGVKTVAELLPENFDKVYEACEIAIAGAGKPPAGDDVGDIM